MLKTLRKKILLKRIKKIEYECDLLELQLEYEKIGYAFYTYVTEKLNRKYNKLYKRYKKLVEVDGKVK